MVTVITPFSIRCQVTLDTPAASCSRGNAHAHHLAALTHLGSKRFNSGIELLTGEFFDGLRA